MQISSSTPYLGGEHLAQLHAPLVKAVDAPHEALRSRNSKRSDALTPCLQARGFMSEMTRFAAAELPSWVKIAIQVPFTHANYDGCIPGLNQLHATFTAFFVELAMKDQPHAPWRQSRVRTAPGSAL